MIVVVDANIIIMALMGSRATLVILTSQNHSFYTPSLVIKEIRKYKHLICAKAGHTFEEFEINLEALLQFLIVLEYIEYEEYTNKAEVAMGQRDIKDSDYLACALAVNADFIWTNDKDFATQNLVPHKTTKQLIDEGR
jgi:predicted nucleic acid-binding protein